MLQRIPLERVGQALENDEMVRSALGIDADGLHLDPVPLIHLESTSYALNSRGPACPSDSSKGILAGQVGDQTLYFRGRVIEYEIHNERGNSSSMARALFFFT